MVKCYPDNHFCCLLWTSKRGGTTFTVGVNVLSVIQEVKKIDPFGGPLKEVEIGLVPKKMVRVLNSESGPLKVNH